MGEAQASIRELIDGLKQLRDSIEFNKKAVDNMPFFVRGFAAQDFKQSTRLSHEEWMELLDDVIGKMENMDRLSSEEEAALKERVRTLVDHLEYYARYLESVPDKIRQASAFINMSAFGVSEESLREIPRYARDIRELRSRLEKLL